MATRKPIEAPASAPAQDWGRATGRHFVTHLYHDEVLYLSGLKGHNGVASLTKPILAEMGVVNWNAARTLGAFLKRHKIASARQLYDFSPQDLVRVSGHGAALLWVAMVLLDKGGFDPMRWWGEQPTYGTVKQHKEKDET
jgi:hypothetical protein